MQNYPVQKTQKISRIKKVILSITFVEVIFQSLKCNNSMKYKFLSGVLLCFIFFQTGLKGQTVNNDQEVVATAGGSTDIGNLNVQWTLGEVFIPTFTVGDFSATQGFNQPKKKEGEEDTGGSGIAEPEGPPTIDNSNCDLALEQNKELGRQGALYAPSDYPINGNEVYTWWQGSGSGQTQVAQFVGNPYYSPPVLGVYEVYVTDPDFPDCIQILGPRELGTLDGCCELMEDN